MKDNINLNDFKTTIKYRVYIGLNDKISKTQLIETSQATLLIKNICERYFNGFTIYTCKGDYKHECGTNIVENTVVVEVIDSLYENIESACNDIKILFSQHNLLIEAKEIKFKYYKSSVD